MSHTTDNSIAVLIAADVAVQSLPPTSRRNLANGAQWVRLPAWAARDLIAAVEELNREDDAP